MSLMSPAEMRGRLSSDLRSVSRFVSGSPGFTLIVILTLALGIGATTSIVSFVYGVLLRPLPFPDPERLVMVCGERQQEPGDTCLASPADWGDWARRTRAFSRLGLARDWIFGVVLEGRTRGIDGGIATPGLFQALGARPVLGRVIEARDIEAGNERVALVSHEFWRSRLGGRPDALGRRLDIDGRSYDVIGVLPAGFFVPDFAEAQIWLPLWPERRQTRDWRGFKCFGRLAPGVSLARARADVSELSATLAREYPETNAEWRARVDSLHEWMTGSVRPALLVMLAAVVSLLLIACANVASLFLARGAARRREFAVRLALGASRGQLVRQLLAESLLVALTGGALGTLGAYWAVDGVRALAPSWFPRLDAVRLDARMLIFTVAVSAATSLLFGLAPSFAATRVCLSDALRDAGRSGVSRRTLRVREGIVVGEIAMACLLLVASGLLLRSFAGLLRWSPGFDSSRLMVVRLFIPPTRHHDAASVVDTYRRCVDEVRSVPGVLAAGNGSGGPLFGGDGASDFAVEGRSATEAESRTTAAFFDIDENYFQTLGVPIVRGRPFSRSDGEGAPRVAILNETLARRLFGSDDPLGRRIRFLMDGTVLEIVGVVRDVIPFWPDEGPGPEIYWPFRQSPRWATTIIARTAIPPERVAAAIRSRLEAVDRDLDIRAIATMDERIAGELVNPRFNLTIVGLFALVATAIALVGVYGVVSYFIEQRTRDIGVRVALGARAADIARLVLGKGLVLAGLGVPIGLAGAAGAMRLLRSLLIGVEPADPLTFAGIGMLLLLVALAACYLPARRAMAVHPIEALRHE